MRIRYRHTGFILTLRFRYWNYQAGNRSYISRFKGLGFRGLGFGVLIGWYDRRVSHAFAGFGVIGVCGGANIGA